MQALEQPRCVEVGPAIDVVGGGQDAFFVLPAGFPLDPLAQLDDPAVGRQGTVEALDRLEGRPHRPVETGLERVRLGQHGLSAELQQRSLATDGAPAPRRPFQADSGAPVCVPVVAEQIEPGVTVADLAEARQPGQTLAAHQVALAVQPDVRAPVGLEQAMVPCRRATAISGCGHDRVQVGKREAADSGPALAIGHVVGSKALSGQSLEYLQRGPPVGLQPVDPLLRAKLFGFQERRCSR